VFHTRTSVSAAAAGGARGRPARRRSSGNLRVTVFGDDTFRHFAPGARVFSARANVRGGQRLVDPCSACSARTEGPPSSVRPRRSTSPGPPAFHQPQPRRPVQRASRGLLFVDLLALDTLSPAVGPLHGGRPSHHRDGFMPRSRRTTAASCRRASESSRADDPSVHERLRAERQHARLRRAAGRSATRPCASCSPRQAGQLRRRLLLQPVDVFSLASPRGVPNGGYKTINPRPAGSNRRERAPAGQDVIA